MAAMAESKNAICIHDEIAAELRTITLDATPFPAAKHQTRILYPYFRLPRPHKRTLQIVRAVCRTLRVEQECKTRAGFGLPGARLMSRSKRNEDDARIRRLKRGSVLAQLCHVLAARQSTQMPQKNEQRILSLSHRLGQGHGFAIDGG